MKGDGPKIALLPPMPDWELSACRSHPDPDLWCSARPADRREALRVCASCPVLAPCAEWSLSLPAMDNNTWGGMTTLERKRRRAARGRAAREEAEALAAAERLAAVPGASATCGMGHDLRPGQPNLVMHRDPGGQWHRHCRECQKARHRAFDSRERLVNPEAVNARQRRDYAASIEDRRAKQRARWAARAGDAKAKARARYAARKAAAAVA